MGSVGRKIKSVGETNLNGRYKILEVIHKSGMSVVYKVSDSQLGTVWCLKEIDKSNAGRNKIEYRSLLKEARIMRGLNHPSIPRIVTIEEEGNSIFIVMDYVSGKSLKEILESKKVLTQSQAVSIMGQVAKVMVYLHSLSNPIIYRDLKPSNIMLMKDGTIRVLDFGISEEITEENKIIQEALGTWGFAAPEQIKKGIEYDLRSDIFSFGRTFYNIVTGINPPRDLNESLKPVRQINSSISVGLEKFINKCMDLDPDKRFQSFSDIVVELPNIDKKEGGYRFRQWLKVGVSALFFVGFLVVGVLGITGKINESTNLEKSYTNGLEIASKTGKMEDWSKAIGVFPLRINPYFSMVNSIKEDGVFSQEEESALLNTISPSLQELTSDKRYKELSFEIGKLYWFYRNGAVEAGKWLYDSVDENETAKVLFELTEFNKNLKTAVLESSDNGMYEGYYKSLIKAMELDGGEILSLAVKSAFVDCVSFYSNKLKRDGVLKKDLLSNLEEIKSSIIDLSPETKAGKDYLSNIKTKLDSAFRALEVSYGQ